MFNKKSIDKNAYMLQGKFKKKGYDWWWHSFTAVDAITGEERPFYIEYFIVNPALSMDKVHFGGLNEKPSYLMVNCGTWTEGAKQLHQFYPMKDVIIQTKPFEIKVKTDANIFASEDHLIGKVDVSEEDVKNHPEYLSDAGSMEWNIKVDKKIAYNVGYGSSKLFRKMKAFQMYWHAQGMKSEMSGWIILDGRKYDINRETSYGYSDKNWGSGFTSPWVWLSSNDIIDKTTGKRLKNTVFDIGGGKPKIFFVSLNRKLLSGLFVEGEEYEFNFSKFWHPTHTKFHCYETDTEVIWHVEQTCKKAKMVTDIRSFKKDMLLIRYEDPLGERHHTKLYNGGAGTGTVQLFENNVVKYDLICGHVGCEYGEFDKKEDENYE